LTVELYLREPLGERTLGLADLPLSVGGEGATVVVPAGPGPAAWIGLHDGQLFVQTAGETSRVLHNGAPISGSAWLRSGDVLDAGGYDESMPAYEDWDLYAALAERGLASCVLPEFLIHVLNRHNETRRTKRPLLAFMGPLKRAKRQALLDYGDLVGRHGRLVHKRWIEGREVGQPPILEAPELGPVADTAAMYDAVRSMRSTPLGATSVLPVALAAALPMIAVLALQMPVMDLARTLLKALL